MIEKLIAALAIVALASCATVVRSPQQVANATSVDFDKYAGLYHVVGMQMDTGEFPNITKFFLRAGFAPLGQRRYLQLYVDHYSQDGWNFFDSASDGAATPLHVTQIDRQVLYGGDVDEYVGIDLPEDYAKAHMNTGMNIRLSGQRGAIVIIVPAAYIQGFMDRYRHALFVAGARG